MHVKMPHKYTPRVYQEPLLQAIDEGYKRAVWVAHRRSGKDKTCINIVATKMLERIGSYFYFFPTFTQAKRVIWEGVDKDGFKMLDHFPKEAIEGKPNDTELKIKYKNGSLFQLIGTDNIDRIVGTNPVGCVFSEYALQDPGAWGYIRPILAENNGWVIFISTPRGENHFYDIYTLAKANPKEWFAQVLTVQDTNAISQEVLDNEKKEIVTLYGNDALYQQEYECNFTVPIAGAYYAEQVMQAYKDGRVGNVAYEDRLLVDTWWDLGLNDLMSIWFVQKVGSELRLIDYYQDTGKGLPHYIQVMKEKRYIYGTHTAPHDIQVRELTSGVARIETAKNLGIHFKVAPKISIPEGIDATRSMLAKCWFDAKKCEIGLNALKNYRKEYDERKKTYVDHPYHDWTSNAADALRTGAVTMNFKLSENRWHYERTDTPNPEWKGGAYIPQRPQAQIPIRSY